MTTPPKTTEELQAAYRARKARDRQARDHRAFVGPTENYDLYTVNQFTLLASLGLREHHSVLDIGCGSLRAGRLLLAYLLPDRYFGIEPEAWLLEEGIRQEVGADLVRLKRPTLVQDAEFTLSRFGRTFDFLLAHSIFSHAAPGQIHRCLSEARRVMSRSSIFAATVVRGQADYGGEEWYHRARYTLHTLQTMAKANGLTLELFRWPHPDRQTWILIRDPDHDAGPDADPDPLMAPHAAELARCRERVARLESHPYVSFGLTVRRWLRRLGERAPGQPGSAGG